MSERETTETAYCSQCGREFDREEAVTVSWANAIFCTGNCRDEWARNTNRRTR